MNLNCKKFGSIGLVKESRLVYKDVRDNIPALKEGAQLIFKDIKNDTIRQTQIDPQHTLELFESYPKPSTTNGFADPTGTTGDENLLVTEKNSFEYHILGTQTILFPGWGANGLDIGSFDAVDNDGVELTQGILARSKSAFVIGTDGPFFFQVDFDIADVSGTDDCAVGFRKAEAYQAAIDNYSDMAALNVISGDIKIETILNAGATVTTDTTDNWADAAKHTLRVIVSAAGVVTYLIDGVAPNTTAALTLDDADTVIPFFYLLNSTDLHGAINITKWECGLV